MYSKTVPKGWTRGERLTSRRAHIPWRYKWDDPVYWTLWRAKIEPPSEELAIPADTIACFTIRASDIPAMNEWLDWWFEDHPENDLHGRFELPK